MDDVREAASGRERNTRRCQTRKPVYQELPSANQGGAACFTPLYRRSLFSKCIGR
jgi:hypothetical protein